MNMNKKEKYEWNLSLLLEDEYSKKASEEKKIIERRIDSFSKKWKERNFLNNIDTLKEVLDDYDNLMAECGTSGKMGYFYFLKNSLNQSDPELKAKLKKIEEFSKKQEEKLIFFELELSKTKEEKQEEILESDKLKGYKNFLRRTFKKGKHMLSEKEEKIINLKSGPAYDNWVGMVSQFLSEETREVLITEKGKETKTFSEIVTLIKDKNKKIRDSAGEALNDILKSNARVAEIEMNSVLEDKKINDGLRNFKRPDESRFISDDVEAKTIDQLVKTVTDNFKVSRDYYELKAHLFGVEKLKYHERSIPYGEIEKEYSFEEACRLVKEVPASLDVDFEKIFDNFIDNGHVDLRPKKGKRGGAFCVHNLITQPVYILLNYGKKLEDVITLIHEVGHGINNEMIRKKQNAINFGVSTFTAEVASTFFEDFITEKIMDKAEKDIKLSMLMNKLDRDISTIYRQIAAINFERDLHKKFRVSGYLSKEEIGNLFKGHMGAYMGDYVEQSEGSENWWVYWSHLRRFFYNYSYAGGLLISKALQKRTRENPEFVEQVKQFLETGTSLTPKETFGIMGIDIQQSNFWDNGIKETKRLLKKAEKLAAEVN